MALYLTIALLCSSAGIVLLLTMKHYELQSGKLLLMGLRPKVGRITHAGVLFVEYVLPSLAVRWARHMALIVRGIAHRATARSIVFCEHMLHRLLAVTHSMTRPPEAGGPASAFLREVAEHKRALQQRASSQRVIFDD